MRSKLFVPGSRPELFEKAAASQPDAISFDLEDAVVAERKAEARENVARFIRERLTGNFRSVIVRVNGKGTPWHEADLSAFGSLEDVIINIPKVESARELSEIIAALPHRADGSRAPVLANIESPAALLNLREIATVEGLMGLQAGYGDLFVSMKAAHKPDLVQHVRIQIRIAAAAAGIVCLDGAFVDVADEAGFIAEAEAARDLGFSGKSCIHPRQVALANRIFMPSDADLAQARAIVEAAEQNEGKGAFMLDGRMVDRPFIEQARRLIDEARAARGKADGETA